MAIEADKTNTAVIVTMFAVGAAAMLGGSAAIVALTRGEVRTQSEKTGAYADLSRVRDLKAEKSKRLSDAKLSIDKARSLVLQQIQADPNAASPFTAASPAQPASSAEPAPSASSSAAGAVGTAPHEAIPEGKH